MSGIAALYGTPAYLVGPDKKTIFFNFGQVSNPFFVIAVNTDTKKTVRINPPMPDGSKAKWSLCRGFIWHPGVKKIFFGSTYEAYVFELDPENIDKGIINLGKPVNTETYIWDTEIGDDGKIYFCTFPNCKLISYDPYKKTFVDHGRAHPTNQYLRFIAKNKAGNIVCGTGIEESDVSVFDIKTSTFKSITPKDIKKPGFASVQHNIDKDVIVTIAGKTYKVSDTYDFVEGKWSGGVLDEYHPTMLNDGRKVIGATIDGKYTIFNPSTKEKENLTFDYSGDGVMVWELTEGPDKKLYGSTALPLSMFKYEEEKKEFVFLGYNSAAAQVYSFANYENKIFTASYGNGIISVYDPSKPWKDGNKPDNNPYNFLNLGPSFMRPRTMYVVNDKLYVFGVTDYGNDTSGIAEIDPKTFNLTKKFDKAITNQGINCAVYDPLTKLHICGSTTHIGNRKPLENNSKLFAFDVEKGTTVWEIQPSSNPAVVHIESMILISPGKVLAVYRNREKGLQLCVVNTEKHVFETNNVLVPIKDIVWRLTCSEDGRIFGVTIKEVFEIDNKDYKTTILYSTKTAGLKVSGPVVKDGYIYFSRGEKVYRLKYK